MTILSQSFVYLFNWFFYRIEVLKMFFSSKSYEILLLSNVAPFEDVSLFKTPLKLSLMVLGHILGVQKAFLFVICYLMCTWVSISVHSSLRVVSYTVWSTSVHFSSRVVVQALSGTSFRTSWHSLSFTSAKNFNWTFL